MPTHAPNGNSMTMSSWRWSYQPSMSCPNRSISSVAIATFRSRRPASSSVIMPSSRLMSGQCFAHRVRVDPFLYVVQRMADHDLAVLQRHHVLRARFQPKLRPLGIADILKQYLAQPRDVMFLLQSRPDIARHRDMEARLPARAVVCHRPEMVRPEAARRDIELEIREQPGHVERPMLRLGRIDRRMAHQYIHDVEAAGGTAVARSDIGIEIGSASGRGRVSLYVSIEVGALELKTKTKKDKLIKSS